MFKSLHSSKQDVYFNELRKGIIDPLDIRQLLLYIITHLSKRLNLQNISILLLNKDTGDYELKESIKLNKSYLTLEHNSPIVQFFTSHREHVVLARLNQIIYKMENTPTSKKANIDYLKRLAKDLHTVEAEVAIPFYKENQLLGIFAIGPKISLKKFFTEDIDLLKRFIAEFSQLIVSASVFEDMRVKEKEMASLYEVSKVISPLADFNKTSDGIVRYTSILLKAPKILIFLFDDLEARYSIKKTFGFSEFQLGRIEESVQFKECVHVLTGSGDGVLIKSRQDNSLFEEVILQDLGIHSILSVSLIDEDMKIIGELRVMRPSMQKPFHERDKEIASSLANNIVVAITNSKRYQKSEENLLELSKIYGITKSLTPEVELEKIQTKICNVFTDELGFQRSLLYMYSRDNKLIAEQASGWDESTTKYKGLSLEIAKTWEGKCILESRIFQVGPSDFEGYDISAAEQLGITHFLVIPLLVINKKPIGVLLLDLGATPPLRNSINLRLLTNIANHAAIIIENARLYRESEDLNDQLRKEQSRTAKELQIAKYIQQGLLSFKLPEHKAYSIYATNIPCRAVGGDFFNFIPYDEKNLGVVIGDVSGKGIPAALLMTMTSSIFSEFGKRFHSPEAIMKAANESLQNYLSRSPIFYVTAFYGMINFETNLLHFCKAGHNPPILYHAKSKSVTMLDGEGTYLGTFDDGGFIEKSILLETGDRLILYTDGIIEARNKERQLFSKDRLAKIICENEKLPAEELAKLIISHVEEFSDFHEFTDDLTLVIIDFKELNQFKEKVIHKLDYTLSSKLTEVKATISDFLSKLNDLEIPKRVYNHIRLSVSESLMNAFEHGNKSDAAKHIKVTGVLTNRKIELSVQDEGSGFDPVQLSYSENQTDITHRGRGITAMKACMDEVRFNEQGNLLTLVKYLGHKGD